MNSTKLVELRDMVMGDAIVTEEPEKAKQSSERIRNALKASAASLDELISLEHCLTDLECSNFEWGLCEGYRLAFRIVTEGLSPITDCTEEQAYNLVKSLRVVNDEQIQSMKDAFKENPELLKIIDLAISVVKGM